MEPFSVLMSVYQKENPNFLKLSLSSVFNQTVKPDEVVLVEDGPLTPDLYSVIEEYKEKYPELKVYPFEHNRGLGRALNSGLRFCTHELVARMDTDDINVSTRFEKELAQFEMNPNLAVCSSWIEEFESFPENVVAVKKLPERHDQLYEFGKRRCPVNHPVSMFRKSIILENGSYLDFPLFEDYYLWVRLMVNGCEFYCIQESLLKFRRSSDMIKRRGGFRYAMTETKLLHMMYGIGYISWLQMKSNMCIRFIARIVPGRMRLWIYQKLRNHTNK